MPVLGTLITMTTYGSWLRGDRRGWVDDGVIMLPDPLLELADTERLAHRPFRFQQEQLWKVGEEICNALFQKWKMSLLALTIQTWHLHMMVPATNIRHDDIVKHVKDAVRYLMKAGQPIWTEKRDDRYCFTWQSLKDRIEYVEAHNLRQNWPAQPWPQLLDWDTYVQYLHR